MITREMIINELVAKGIEAQPNDVVKNGVTFKGITLGAGTIRPTIYIEQFLDYAEEDIEDVVDAILYQYDKAKEDVSVINLDNILDWDNVKTKLQLCIQKKGNEDIVKRDFLDLEEYVRVNVGGNGSFKVKPEHLEKFGVTEDVLFHAAWDCTAPTIKIEDMAQILAEMGMSVPPTESMMIVASNERKVFGAIAIKSVDKIVEIADRYETDLAILPSSIHEVLLIPVKDDTNFIDLDAMVQDVNATQVAPEEILSNHAYRFNREERSITYYHDTKSGKYTF